MSTLSTPVPQTATAFGEGAFKEAIKLKRGRRGTLIQCARCPQAAIGTQTPGLHMHSGTGREGPEGNQPGPHLIAASQPPGPLRPHRPSTLSLWGISAQKQKDLPVGQEGTGEVSGDLVKP